MAVFASFKAFCEHEAQMSEPAGKFFSVLVKQH